MSRIVAGASRTCAGSAERKFVGVKGKSIFPPTLVAKPLGMMCVAAD